MKIELADCYGFCFGVKRAIKLAEDSKDSVVIGELIHNLEEIKRLEDDYNVKNLNSIDEITDEKKIIIRTHGITKSDLIKLKSKNVEIINATCPFVTKPQLIVEKMSNDGYDIVIFGDKNHPEVKSVYSYATGNVFVVLSEDELKDIKFKQKVALVSQTTKKLENFLKIANFLITNIKEVRVFNTICNATLKNQEATEKLSKKVDVMIIIGGKHSSNTKQLFLIASKFCKNTYLVENENDIQKDWFLDKKICGISAGASTPQWIIFKIIDKIKILSKV